MLKHSATVPLDWQTLHPRPVGHFFFFIFFSFNSSNFRSKATTSLDTIPFHSPLFCFQPFFSSFSCLFSFSLNQTHLCSHLHFFDENICVSQNEKVRRKGKRDHLPWPLVSWSPLYWGACLESGRTAVCCVCRAPRLKLNGGVWVAFSVCPTTPHLPAGTSLTINTLSYLLTCRGFKIDHSQIVFKVSFSNCFFQKVWW